jgi:hypothetical protein
MLSEDRDPRRAASRIDEVQHPDQDAAGKFTTRYNSGGAVEFASISSMFRINGGARRGAPAGSGNLPVRTPRSVG